VEDDSQRDKQKGVGTVIFPDKDTGYEEQDEDTQAVEVDLPVIQYRILGKGDPAVCPRYREARFQGHRKQ
jgi:hypothetical protein